MKSKIIQAALNYTEKGFKVFPVKIDKKPHTKHGLKDATLDKTMVEKYWNTWPGAGIGLVTEGLIVLDFDKGKGGFESKSHIEEKFGPLPHTLTHKTGGGGLHYIYLNATSDKVRCRTNLGGYEGVDLRADGGYIIVPPSLHNTGEAYTVLIDSPIVAAPQWILELSNTKFPKTQPNLESGSFLEGKRNTALTSVAGSLKAKGINHKAIEAALLELNRYQCMPPLEKNEVIKIASSINKYPMNHPDNNDKYSSSINCPSTNNSDSKHDKTMTKSMTRPLSDRIEAWLKESNGWFHCEEMDKELCIVAPGDKDNRRHIIKRLRDAGIIEVHPTRNRLYRYIDTSVRLIDFKSTKPHAALAIKYPFSIEKYFKTYPGNIVVLAGAANAGKTAFLLNFIKYNQANFQIFYQSSEMGAEELASRLELFDDIGLQDWNFNPEERSANFADTIRPDCINIIDYLEISSDFYRVAEYLRQIYDRLASGICIVALQKKQGVLLGRGGDFGLEKPRLYLSMDTGKLTIQKAKNWASPSINPNGLTICFKLTQGCKFAVTKDWHSTRE